MKDYIQTVATPNPPSLSPTSYIGNHTPTGLFPLVTTTLSDFKGRKELIRADAAELVNYFTEIRKILSHPNNDFVISCLWVLVMSAVLENALEHLL
jgi:hypothetical protein